MSSFGPAAGEWGDKLGLVRDVVRQELVRRELLDNLHRVTSAEPGAELEILDVGCGQGTQAVALARAGHRVIGVDPSGDLLGQAQQVLDDEPGPVQARVQFRLGTLADLPTHRYDVVCCHGVVMYLDRLADSVECLAAAVRPGGLLSILTRNRAGIAMRAGMSGHWADALDGFDARHYDNRIGVPDVRADEPDEVFDALAAAGIETAAWFGVRLFTDHWGDIDPPTDAEELESLLTAEREAGRRDPYRRLAALTHTIGRRPL